MSGMKLGIADDHESHVPDVDDDRVSGGNTDIDCKIIRHPNRHFMQYSF